MAESGSCFLFVSCSRDQQLHHPAIAAFTACNAHGEWTSYEIQCDLAAHSPLQARIAQHLHAPRDHWDPVQRLYKLKFSSSVQRGQYVASILVRVTLCLCSWSTQC